MDSNPSNQKRESMEFSRNLLPMDIFPDVLEQAVQRSKSANRPIMAVVIGTKPDFYKQAPLVVEAERRGYPVFVIDTGQHFDEVLGFGVKEFDLQRFVGCNLNIRGDLMEKASELIVKFGSFGRHFRKRYGNSVQMLPIVHGDTLVAGIAPLAWVFGIGQKVGQNEAGLRSMCPEAMRGIGIDKKPGQADIEKFVDAQLNGKWFIAREEPFPEQIDTWICSAGVRYFFAPTQLNKDNLVREGYPEESAFVVGNSVVDALAIKRSEKSERSVFDLYPQLENGEWIRMDIHRRENLTNRRFSSIVGAITDIVKNTDHKLVLVMLNATASALSKYGYDKELNRLASEHKDRFLMTPLWKEYAHVVEFLDSGHCWAELTDSGSMQEELLYFPKVTSLTARLNTDRPETVFDAKSNVLVPPVSRDWMTAMINEAHRSDGFGSQIRRKKEIYGRPGEVSKRIIEILNKEFEGGKADLYPWLHHRMGMWWESEGLDYM
ncbi:MAG: UDP-N-acetylglucosamine 2-epimerase [Candidatus Micrarchaeota archaeon]|nr:UDP-N-acetylglucosamine 2-epimerase [Candidatus Micrarchaeota archaeon]